MTITGNRSTVSLADLETFDPTAPTGSRERRFCCPLPHPICTGKAITSAHRSLSVNLATGEWYCHRCEAGGTIRESWTVRPRLLHRDRARVDLARAFALRQQPACQGDDPPTAHTWRGIWRGTVPLRGTPGASYLEGRGIPVEIAARSAVRFARSWFGRPSVVFPLSNNAREIVAAQGRSITGNAKITAGPKSQGVFPTPGAWESDPVAIVEAPIDALSLAVTGVPALALCGKTAPHWLPPRLAFRHVLVATDADDGGDEGAERLAPLLRSFGAKAERWRPVGAKDPNELLQQDPMRFAVSILWPGARLKPTADWPTGSDD
jgi:hypothetical protein